MASLSRMSLACRVVESESLVAQNQPVVPQAVDPNHVEYDFVEQPSQDFFCPVTLELLINPHQTTCCGNHLSQEAVNRLQRDGKPCPMCNEAELNTVTDKFYKRRVSEVKVRCPYKKMGCEWVGEVGSLNQHSQSCPKRPWQCQYCDLVTTYDIGPNEHIPKCTKYPEPCPNSCEIGTVPRCDVEKHKTVCPLEIVSCGYADVGCDVKVCRRDLARHMEEGQQQHLLSATLLNLRLTRENTKEKERLSRIIEEKDQALSQQAMKMQCELTERDQQIKLLKENVDSLRNQLISIQDRFESKVSSLQQQIPTSAVSSVHRTPQLEYIKMCFDRTSNGFSGHELVIRRFSQFLAQDERFGANNMFYSHPEGLQLSLSVYYSKQAYCSDSCIGVSFYLNGSGYSRKQPNHLFPQWPFNVTVSIQLLNQLGDHNHYEVTITARRMGEEWLYDDRLTHTLKFGDGSRYELIDIPGFENEYLQEIDFSVCDFIKFSDLGLNADKNTQYLMYDCLHFRLYFNITPIQWVHKKEFYKYKKEQVHKRARVLVS